MSAESAADVLEIISLQIVQANFQADITFINKPRIRSLKVHSRLKELLKLHAVTQHHYCKIVEDLVVRHDSRYEKF